MNSGLTSSDLWVLEQLCIKANNEQLRSMKQKIQHEERKRSDRMLEMLVGRVPEE